jgi:hypothetical protein
MKVLVFSDLQADDGSDRLRSDPSWPLQRWRTREFYAWAAATVKQRNLSAVWDLGDSTHNRSALTHTTVQTVLRGCAELTAGLRLLLNFKLLGNHEQHLKAQHAHVGDLFRGSFHVVEERQVFELSSLAVICASFCPASKLQDTESWLKAEIERAREAGLKTLVLGHFAIGGSRLSSGSYAEGLSLDALAGADLTLLGHVHRRQSLAPNVHYIGSPFQQDFGEAGDPPKSALIVDLNTLEIEWLEPVTSAGTLFPRHRIIGIDELPDAARTNDILRVQIRNAAEAQQLYASPHSSSVQPVYAFASEDGADTAPAASLDFSSLTQAYVAGLPLAGVTAGELLNAARQLSG